MKRFRAALAQMDSQGDMRENLKKIENFTAEAAGSGADLIVFPEVVNYIGEDYPGHAVEVPGEISDFFGALAKKYRIFLHGGSITVKGAGGSRNQTLLFGPDGERLASYSKIHLFDIDVPGVAYRESDTIEAGDEITVADTPLGKLGLSICYDLRFPQLYQIMADRGAEVLICCANFTDKTGEAHWETLLRARAIENTCYVLACGQCGKKYNTLSHGHSMVIDPWGRILAEAGDRETILYADPDPQVLAEIRAQLPCLKGRREDVYRKYR